MSDVNSEKNITSNVKDLDSLLDETDITSLIDDIAFDIPTLDVQPTLESILHEEDPKFDDLSLSSASITQRNFTPFDDRSLDKSSQRSFDSSADGSTAQPIDNYLLKIHHQQQDASGVHDSLVEIPKHKTIVHGSLLKVSELQTISNQIISCIERTNYGQPTTVDVAFQRLIVVGTTKGVVLLFEYRTETLKHCLLADPNDGAVSTLNLNSDATRLLVGYARGRIQMYDCSNGKLLRTILADCHAPETGILTVKFTHDPTIALFGDTGGSVYVLHFTRHLRRDYQSKCIFSGSRGEVCAIEPLLFPHTQDSLTNQTTDRLDQHPLKSIYLVALATFTKIFLLALRSQENVKILHVHRLVGSNSTLPLLKWQFVIVKVSDQTNCVSPILAAVRDRLCTFFQIQYIRDDEVQVTQLKQFQVDYQIKSFAWLNARTIVMFDMSERAHVVDFRSEEQLECLSLTHCELVYNTIFFKSLATGGNVSTAFALAGQNACYQTLISNQGHLYLLGLHKLYRIHLRDWSERIDYFLEDGKHQYQQALELTYLMFVGKAKGLTGLPIDPEKRRQSISERMVSLLQAYLKYSLSEECFQAGKIELLKQHYRTILPRSINYCLLLDRLDLCFGLIYDIFSRDPIAQGIYLQCLEPYIMSNRFEKLAPNVLRDFINFYVENNHFNQLEQCLNRLDMSCLDIEQTVTITRKHDLYMTLLHLYSEAFKDFRIILQEIIEKLEDDFIQNGGTGFSEKMILAGNQALVFIQSTFAGDVYPFGGRLSKDLAYYGRNELMNLLSHLHPRHPGGLLYTNLRTLLHFNTRDFFNLLTMAFDNEEFLQDVEVIKRRAFCDILLRVMVDDVQFSSHQISILFNFLSRQLAKEGQQHVFVQGMLFEQVLEYLCKSVLTSTDSTDESKDEREQSLLDVIQAAGLQSFDIKRLLTLARQAQFWRVCQIIYAENNQYDMVLESSMNDRQLRSNLFRYIRTIWPSLDENQRNKMRRKIMENFTAIIQIEPMKAFKLFCVFFQMDLNEVLQIIDKNEKCQYEILKSCFAYSDEAKSASTPMPFVSIDPLHYFKFIELLARFDPNQLLNFLKSKSTHYRPQEVLDVIQPLNSSMFMPSIVFLLESLGRYTETFDLLLKSMHNWQSFEHLYQMALDCVQFCQRTAVKLKNKQQREELWLRFLDEILLISSSKSLDAEQLAGFHRIYGEILNSMIGYVTLPAILERIMRSDAADITKSSLPHSEITNRSKFEIRQLIQSMLENCSFELRLLETTRRLLQRDLNDDIEQMSSLMSKSVAVRKNQCSYCQKPLQQSLINRTSDTRAAKQKFLIFACRHIFHLNCLLEIQGDSAKTHFCPQCQINPDLNLNSSTTSSSPSSSDRNNAIAALRRPTLINIDQYERELAVETCQQQVLTAISKRNQSNVRHIHSLDQTSYRSIIDEENENFRLPETWRQHIAPTQ